MSQIKKYINSCPVWHCKSVCISNDIHFNLSLKSRPRGRRNNMESQTVILAPHSGSSLNYRPLTCSWADRSGCCRQMAPRTGFGIPLFFHAVWNLFAGTFHSIKLFFYSENFSRCKRPLTIHLTYFPIKVFEKSFYEVDLFKPGEHLILFMVFSRFTLCLSDKNCLQKTKNVISSFQGGNR